MKYLYLFLLFGFSLMPKVSGQRYVDPSIDKKMKLDGSCPVLIVFKHKLDQTNVKKQWTKIQKGNFVYSELVAMTDKSQSNVKNYLFDRNVTFQSFYINNSIKTNLTQQQLNDMISFEEVSAVLHDANVLRTDYLRESDEIVSNRVVEPEWGIKKIKADSAWMMNYRGQGVVVGGLDTGFSWDLDALRSKYRGYKDSTVVIHPYNWHDAIHTNSPAYPDSLLNPCGFSVKYPCDDDNHGTHTMGTMVGSDAENQIGVAPDATWIACRNMDRGYGKPSTYLECFEWMLAPRDENFENPLPQLSPDVINNSWYCSKEEGCDDINRYLFEAAINNLEAAGIFVVISAGNGGSGGCGSIKETPAVFSTSFSVGATNDMDEIAGFSSRGPVVIDSIVSLKPNVSAPGVNVRSTIRNGGFADFSGTSMSGPHVAGAIALLISADPSLRGKVDVLTEILQSTAEHLTSDITCDPFDGMTIPNAIYGYGRIDVYRAIKMALSLSSTDDSKNSENTVTIFPNPAHEVLNIKSETSPIMVVKIYDQQGRNIKSQKLFDESVLYSSSISHLLPGIYTVSVMTKTTISHHRIVVN